jgi:hypothetical protein
VLLRACICSDQNAATSARVKRTHQAVIAHSNIQENQMRSRRSQLCKSQQGESSSTAPARIATVLAL